MINLGRDILVLTVDESRLRAAIRDAALDVKDLHERLHGVYANAPKRNRAPSFGFLRMFEHQLRNGAQIDTPSRSLQLLMDAVLMNGQQRSADPIAKAFNADPSLNVPVTQYAGLFRGVAAMLLYLWQHGHVVLNPYFSPNLKAEELYRYESETLRDFKQVVASSNYLSAERWNVEHHSKRLFWVTDWITWERFSLAELAEVHGHWASAKRRAKSNNGEYPIPPIPFRILLRELNGGLADKVSINGDELDKYSHARKWASEGGGRYHSAEHVEYATRYAAPSKWRDEEAIFVHLANVREGEQKLARWPGAVSVRPGWEDLPVRESGSVWSRLFEGFLADWRK